MGNLPPLERMIGRFLGYTVTEVKTAKKRSMEEQAAYLIGKLTGG